MIEKKCFKCGVTKPRTAFYNHPRMPDGTVNKCKDCNKADVRENRKSKIDYYRQYDRMRGSRQTLEYHRSYKERFPKKYKARTAVGNAIRDGRLKREPCEVCGDERVHGHHDDYDKPLEVRWLCPAHHNQWHQENGDGKNPV